uniref:JmjC domain-containing protein n=1 Tax=Chrysotila carterae TaxID=13221 RepID=A0A7S4BKS2_CHRCT
MFPVHASVVPSQLQGRAARIAQDWLRSGRLSRDALSHVLPDLHVKVRSDPYFMYTAAGSRGAQLLPDAAGGREELRQMRARDFFEQAERAAPPYLYYTSPLQVLGDDVLSRAPSWEQLALTSAKKQSVQGAIWAQLWACSGGGTTQAHYDVADNTFVQLEGVKDFYLFPPSAADALHVFPDSHPRARKAQLNVEAPDMQLHPLAASLPTARKVTLHPGEVLFIPAFWFHHVVSRSPTISINVFSQSAVPLAAASLLAQPLPIPAQWPVDLKRRALTHLLDEILNSAPVDLVAAGSARELADRLLQSRFAPLRQSGEISSEAAEPKVEVRRRRKELAEPPSWDDVAALISGYVEDCVFALRRLRQEVDDAGSADSAAERQDYYEGVCACARPRQHA